MPNATILYSNKGGSGTTVVAAALAVLLSKTHSTMLVSDDGCAALGFPEITDGDRSSVSPTLVVASEMPDLRLTTDVEQVIIDAGQVPRSWTEDPFPPGRRILVTRCCFLSLRRAMGSAVKPDGIVVLVEPGRALSVADVEDGIGAPVVAHIPVDPSIARAVDAGLLAVRPPKAMKHGLGALTRHLDPSRATHA